jgi:hypothetical protein
MSGNWSLMVLFVILWARPPRLSECLTLQCPSRWGRSKPLAPHLATALQTAPIVFVNQSFLYLCSGKEVLFMSTEEKAVKVEQASKLAKWFKISIEISIFDHVIFSKTWPPQD